MNCYGATSVPRNDEFTITQRSATTPLSSAVYFSRAYYSHIYSVYLDHSSLLLRTVP